MKINKFRGKLYKLAKVLGWIQAFQSGKIGQRIVSVFVGRIASRLRGNLLHKLFKHVT